MLEQSLTGRPRSRFAKHFWSTRTPVCHLCHYPIDMTADPQRDPLARAIDEIIPRSRGGSALDPTNTKPAHRWCNGSRRTHPLVPWDPAWPTRTMDPEEVRTRCRTHITALLNATQPTLRPW